MSVAPPPATYTATNDLNILKNIFVPQYKLSNGYYHASVNTHLPGNVIVGDTTTNFAITMNGAALMTLSDLQAWSIWYASTSLNMNSNAIYNASTLKFLGGSVASPYTIDAATGTINVSQYWLKGAALTLSGGLPAWSTYPATSNVNINAKSMTGVGSISLSSGGTLLSPASNAIAFSNAFGEQLRITASGSLSVGTTVAYAGYSLNVSGGSILQTPLRVVNEIAQLASNSFFVQTVPSSGNNYDVRMGALGPATDLLLCTGTPAGSFGNNDCIKIDGTGNLTLLRTGAGITTSGATALNTIGGVKLQDFYVTSRLNISLISGSPLTLNAAKQSTTFLLTVNTPSIALPGANVSQGVYWAIKNVSTGSMSITPTGGSIVNLPSPFTMLSNALLTIVFSGTASNYYAL
jgi:hypothetical protein